jgi:hypothetical protein
MCMRLTGIGSRYVMTTREGEFLDGARNCPSSNGHATRIGQEPRTTSLLVSSR